MSTEQPDEPPVRWRGLMPLRFPSPPKEGRPVLSDEELEALVVRATRVRRAGELARTLQRRPKAELLRMAEEAGLHHDSPHTWRKAEIAAALADLAHPARPEEEIG
ncbi:hypothetical protein [Streptomyces lydicus]|uniref:hypothetical protein n=1 Tax=Streptomyces lydicus TaxID=47763 RepID=UPI0013E95BF5|nr:hypothetical protein [Streptomyces lydicus]MCZ1011994.1 hypothetical protein [Streptomyces lydicus]